MKKLDKLIIQSFIGPFILTFLVAVFILLIQYMLKYFDDFIGKDLGLGVFGELMMYFSVNMMPMALPLAVLISSLMTYGQLGEHFELTAIKSAGISLPRVLLPTFVFAIFLSIGAFFLNNHLVPYANLRAYSLLYDIKQQKPALDLKEGQFYGGLPGFSMKVKDKDKDGIGMSDVIIYDHTKSNGNKKVILAKRCRMYTFNNDRYLMMELYNGNYYVEDEPAKKGASKKNKGKINRLVKTEFSRMDLVFSLSSFDLEHTDMDLFAGNRYMKSVAELTESIDSMRIEKSTANYKLFGSVTGNYRLHLGGYLKPADELITIQLRRDSVKRERAVRDSVIAAIAIEEQLDSLSGNMTVSEGENLTTIRREPSTSPQIRRGFNEGQEALTPYRVGDFLAKQAKLKEKNNSLMIRGEMDLDTLNAKIDKYFHVTKYSQATDKALNLARSSKSTIKSAVNRVDYFNKSVNSHVVEKYKKYAQALSCLIMFLIGAPLGAIIKKGGLGFPVILGVIFFIIFYVFTSASDKWAKAGMMDGAYAAWVSDLVLLPFGIFFLIQAKRDARLFDTDFYLIWVDKAVTWWKNRRGSSAKL
ncbi:MAG: LptF/LptG family permease [Reichenbachiella sp.]